MEIKHNDLPEWQPNELLEQAAAQRGFTVEQFRARVRAVAENARKGSGHVSFEHARDLSLSDEDLMHVERCRFCADLLRTIHPTEGVVRDFQKLVERQLEPATNSSSWFDFIRPATAMIAVVGIMCFFIGIGVVNIGIWWRSSLSPATMDSFSIHQSFANAVQYQQRGKTDIANAFLVEGFVTAGLKQPQLQLVTSTLNTAAEPIKAGDHANVHKDVLKYLKSTDPNGLATKMYSTDFMDRLKGLPARADPHIADAAEAIKHAEESISEGQKGTAKAVAEHAQEALKHAEVAQKAKADPHVTEAEKALKEAIEHGNMGHADVAGKAAGNALSHLEMAYKDKEMKEKETVKEKETRY